MHESLNRVALEVRRWRKDSARPMAAVPEEIQKRVVRLLETHSWADVCSATGVGKSSLALWRRRHREELGLVRRTTPRQPRASARAPKKQPRAMRPVSAGFIELPVAAVSGVEIEVKLPAGIILTARGGVDPLAIGQLVARVINDTRAGA